MYIHIYIDVDIHIYVYIYRNRFYFIIVLLAACKLKSQWPTDACHTPSSTHSWRKLRPSVYVHIMHNNLCSVCCMSYFGWWMMDYDDGGWWMMDDGWWLMMMMMMVIMRFISVSIYMYFYILIYMVSVPLCSNWLAVQKDNACIDDWIQAHMSGTHVLQHAFSFKIKLPN